MRRRSELGRDTVVQRWRDSSPVEHIRWVLCTDLWLPLVGRSRCCFTPRQWRLCLPHGWSHASNLASTGAETDHCVTRTVAANRRCFVKRRCRYQLVVSCSCITVQFKWIYVVVRWSHAGITAGVGRAFSRVRLFVCLFVRALTWKRLELSTPNLVHVYSIAVARHALTQRSKGQRSRLHGYENCHGPTVASDHVLCSAYQYAAVLYTCGCCRRGSVCRHVCRCQLETIGRRIDMATATWTAL